MTELDIKLLPKVKAALIRLGKAVSVEVPGATTYDPRTGEQTSAAGATYTVKIIPPAAYEHKYVDGTNILVGDTKTYVAGLDLAFTPSQNDLWTIDGQKWRCVNTKRIYSGEAVVLWEVQLRR